MADLARDTLVVLPECGRRWFIDDHSGARYETYVTDELLPLLRAEYGATGPVTVGGFSAGGAAAFFLALRHPEAVLVGACGRRRLHRREPRGRPLQGCPLRRHDDPDRGGA